MRLENYCPNISMETIFINTENNKTSEKTEAWINMLLFKTIHKLKIIVPTWNNEFELPDGSYYVLDIQDYIG